MKNKLTITFLIILSFAAFSYAQIPQLLNFQGFLSSPAGEPISATVSIAFNLYASEASDAVSLWTETQDVVVSNGLFNVLMGAVNPVPTTVFDGHNRFLGLTIGADPEMTPRYRLVSNGYSYHAFHANRTDSLGGKTSASFVQTVEAVTPLSGNIDLEAGDNVSITPDAGNHKITISATPGGGGGDITQVNAGQGLSGGGETGEVTLHVGAGDGVTVNADNVAINTEFTDSRYVNEGQANGVTTAMLLDNAATAAKVAPNIVSSISGVSNDGGDIQLVAGDNVSITPDDANNKITIAATTSGAGGDITAVTAGQGLSGGGGSGDVTLNVGAGNGITVNADNIELNTTFADGRYVNEGQSNAITTAMLQNDAVTTAKISPDVVSSIDGVSNDGGDIDFVAGSNITITPSDANNRITFDVSSIGDNLGNHTATQNVKLNGNWLSGDGGNEGVYINNTGYVGIGKSAPACKLDVDGTIKSNLVQATIGPIISGSPSSSYTVGDIAATADLKADNNIIAKDGYIRTGSPSASYSGKDIVADSDVKADDNIIAMDGYIRTGSPGSGYGPGDIAATSDLLADDNITAKDGYISTGVPAVSYSSGDIASTKDVRADNNIITQNGFIQAGPASSSGGSGDVVADDDLIADDECRIGNDLIVNDHACINYTSVHVAYQLYVSGSAYATGVWNSSDIKFKQNINEIETPLDKVNRLQGVSYEWKADQFPEKEFDNRRQFGLIAQEVEKILPEIVKVDDNGDKAINYAELIPVLIEAIKQQQKMIEDLQNKLNR